MTATGPEEGKSGQCPECKHGWVTNEGPVQCQGWLTNESQDLAQGSCDAEAAEVRCPFFNILTIKLAIKIKEH